jgi:hypothetical protein
MTITTWIGCALCTLALGAEQGPQLTDAEFFAGLDLSGPTLAAAQLAVQKQDWPTAPAFATSAATWKPPPCFMVRKRLPDREHVSTNPKALQPSEVSVLAVGRTSARLGVCWSAATRYAIIGHTVFLRPPMAKVGLACEHDHSLLFQVF